MNGVTQVEEHLFEIGGNYTPPGTPEAAPAPVPPLAAPIAHSAPSVVSKPADVRTILAQLRARLREVKRELKNKAALETERDQLQRLIRAATTELDNVRRLRAAG